MKDDIIAAHKHSINNRKLLEHDSVVGCFYCLEIFSPSEIVEWCPDKIDDTALCPYCGIDSILGEYTGFPITKEFLTAMQAHWFEGI